MKTSKRSILKKWVSHIGIIALSATLLTACGKKQANRPAATATQTNPLGIPGAGGDQLQQILGAVQCQNGGQRVPLFYQGQAQQSYGGWINAQVSGQPGGAAGFLPGQTFYGKSAYGDVIAVTQNNGQVIVAAYFCGDSIMNPQNQGIYAATLNNFALRTSYNCPGIGVVSAGRMVFNNMINPWNGQPFYQDFWAIDAAPSISIPGLCQTTQQFGF